jgi:hypothetical protein
MTPMALVHRSAPHGPLNSLFGVIVEFLRQPTFDLIAFSSVCRYCLKVLMSSGAIIRDRYAFPFMH